jgi:hypothetical protein
MSDTAEKARALRLARLRSGIDERLTHPAAALETLMSELKIGQQQSELWEGLHAAAARDDLELELAEAYRKMATNRRLTQLAPPVHAAVLMHAADFSQGVLGDTDGADEFLRGVLEVTPDHAEAFSRLERRFTEAGDDLRLVELYALVASAPPKSPDDLARRAVNIIAQLPAKSRVSDAGCTRLLALLPASSSLINVLEAHCRKTNRFALACTLIEQAMEKYALPEARIVELRRRLVELYTGPANVPEKAIAHVEELLLRDSSDTQARAGAERLLSNREVASRAAAALQRARRQGQAPRG